MMITSGWESPSIQENFSPWNLISSHKLFIEFARSGCLGHITNFTFGFDGLFCLNVL